MKKKSENYTIHKAMQYDTLLPAVLICECNSTEHQIVINYDEEDNVAYCHIHLTTHKNFFKRLWAGLRYAFGHKCRYGNWDEFILSDKHAKQLKELSKLLARHGR